MSEETAVEETTEVTEEAPASTGATSQEVTDKTNEILTEIKEKLNSTPKADQPSQQEIRNQIRERIKNETQMTDQQLDYVDNMVMAAVAPIKAELTVSRWISSKGTDITPEIEKGIKEELKQYPANAQNDPILLEKILLMEQGKQYRKVKSAPAKPAAASTESVAGRRIVPAPATGLGEGSSSTKNNLSDDEKLAARKMSMTEDEYIKAKSTKVIGDLKKK